MKLLDDIRHHLATLNSGQQQREAAVLLREAATALADTRWIPVSERRPAEGVRCIIAVRVPGRYIIDGEPKDGYEIEFGEWHGNSWKSFAGPGKTTLHPSMVSHWMPLPEPPEQP
jgi:hypothetical protein